MLKPSITFDSNTVKPIWSHCSLDDVKEMIKVDVAELNRARLLQVEDLAVAERQERLPDIRITILVEAWEHTQDVHWSWYGKLLNVGSAATQGPQGLGPGFVGSGNE